MYSLSKDLFTQNEYAKKRAYKILSAHKKGTYKKSKETGSIDPNVTDRKAC